MANQQTDQERIVEIHTRMEHMQNTLEGCDWCCGGGDAEWEELTEELEQLGGPSWNEVGPLGLPD